MTFAIVIFVLGIIGFALFAITGVQKPGYKSPWEGGISVEECSRRMKAWHNSKEYKREYAKEEAFQKRLAQEAANYEEQKHLERKRKSRDRYARRKQLDAELEERQNKKRIEKVKAAKEHNSRTRTVIYLWEAIDVESHGTPVYKIGITSPHLLEDRIHKVAGAHGVTPRIIRLEHTRAKAYVVESALLKLGFEVDMGYSDGHTEFRALKPADLVRANELIDAAMK